MLSTRPFFVEKIPVKIPDIKPTKFYYKDFSRSSLLKDYPELEEVIDYAVSSVVEHFQISGNWECMIDFAVRRFKKGGFVGLSGTNWHTDGHDGDYYAIISLGEGRTQFLDKELDIIPDGGRLVAARSLPQSGMRHIVEAPNGGMVLYDYRCIHRPVKAQKDGERFFLRIRISKNTFPRNALLPL